MYDAGQMTPSARAETNRTTNAARGLVKLQRKLRLTNVRFAIGYKLSNETLREVYPILICFYYRLVNNYANHI